MAVLLECFESFWFYLSPSGSPSLTRIRPPVRMPSRVYDGDPRLVMESWANLPEGLRHEAQLELNIEVHPLP